MIDIEPPAAHGFHIGKIMHLRLLPDGSLVPMTRWQRAKAWLRARFSRRRGRFVVTAVDVDAGTITVERA